MKNPPTPSPSPLPAPGASAIREVRVLHLPAGFWQSPRARTLAPLLDKLSPQEVAAVTSPVLGMLRGR